MLNSLAAVTKLLVNSSALSGKQQQQQQDAAVTRLGIGASRTADPSSAWPAGLAATADSAAATADHHGLGAEGGAVNGGLAALHGGAAAGTAADARWAEQEHALLLMRSILQVR
jgi:hypothetical protein